MSSSSEVLKKAQAEKDWENGLWAEDKRVIPKEFQGFVLPIEQNKRLVDFETTSPELAKLGCFPYKGKTFIKQRRPYMSVDGRVAWAQSEGLLEIITEPEQIMGEHFMRCTAKTARGVAPGHAQINFGGKGVDSTNPVENAETSAVGRALGFLAYGVIGGCIASYEEVVAAIKARGDETEAESPPVKTAPAETEAAPAALGVSATTIKVLKTEKGQSTKGTNFVAVYAEADGKQQCLYALAPDVMDKILTVPQNGTVKVQLGKQQGKTVITGLVAVA